MRDKISINSSNSSGKIVFGNKTITYSIVRSRRRKKTITLSVEPGGNLIIRAPIKTKDSKLSHIVKSKAKWIIKKRSSLNHGAIISKKEFVSGESFSYLGRHIRLKILRDNSKKKPVVKLHGGRLQILFYRANRNGNYSKEIRDAIAEWYRKLAVKRITERVVIYAGKLGLPKPEIIIRNQQKRWGSCNKKGELRFNWHIVMAPMSLVDYVVVHELCHIKYKDHSKVFWKYLGSIMPDYEKRKEKIKKDGVHWYI